VIGPPAARLRWVAGDALHLTLRFLGEITEQAVGRVAAAAGNAAASTPPFSITLAGLGGFPSLREPRVLWIGVADGGAPLDALARTLEGELVAGGFPPEARPFHPHLTLARARSVGAPPDLRRCTAGLAWPTGAAIGVQHVDAIVVVESTLGTAGPTYREVSRAALGG
jgi:2'-5' RNA ligase